MQLMIVILGVFILGIIFLRRYLILEDKIDLVPFFAKKRNLLAHFHLNKNDDIEISMEELIPDVSTIDPKTVAKADIHYRKADIFLNRGDLRNAARTLIQALSLNPALKEAYSRLALIYMKESLFSKAENIYRKLIMTVNDDPTFYNNLGMALYSQRKLEEAKNFYKKAIDLDDKRAGRIFSLSQILYELGEIEDALEHVKKAIILEPRNLDYLLTLAQFYVETGRPDEARQVLNEVLSLSPGNRMALDIQEKLADVKDDVK